MSLHPSLHYNSAGSQQRSVLTRIERIKDLMKRDLWADDHPITGLPKTKIVRVKAQKSKAKEEGEEATGEGAPSPEATDAKNAPAKEAAKA